MISFTSYSLVFEEVFYFSLVNSSLMENSAPNPPIVVLKITNMCCTAYQKKLNKEIYKLDGVISISINPCQSLVSIRGKVERDLLLNTVAKTGKYAEIVYLNKNPSNISDNHHDNDFGRGENAHDRQHWTTGSLNSHRRRNCCREEDNRNKMEEKEEEHKREKYVPPPIDERICRDYYGRGHRMRPIFCDNSYNFGYFPHHASLNSHPKYPYGPSSSYGYYSRRFGQGYLSGRIGLGLDGYGFPRGWGW